MTTNRNPVGQLAAELWSAIVAMLKAGLKDVTIVSLKSSGKAWSLEVRDSSTRRSCYCAGAGEAKAALKRATLMARRRGSAIRAVSQTHSESFPSL